LACGWTGPMLKLGSICDESTIGSISSPSSILPRVLASTSRPMSFHCFRTAHCRLAKHLKQGLAICDLHWTHHNAGSSCIAWSGKAGGDGWADCFLYWLMASGLINSDTSPVAFKFLSHSSFPLLFGVTFITLYTR
jgi:hypothetical protein